MKFKGLYQFLKGPGQDHLYPIFFASKIGYRLVSLYRNLRWMKRVGSLRALDSIEHEKARNGETFFILGCGASVNDYTEKQWEYIRNNRSIGINNWVLHDFVPDYLMLELLGNCEPALKVIGMREREYEGREVILKGNYCDPEDYRGFDRRVASLPKCIHEKTYLAKDFPIPGDTVEGLRRSLRWLNQMGVFGENSRLGYFGQVRATITTAAFMGIRLGFKKIVLCGVDLNNVDYFFTEQLDYYKAKNYPIPDTRQPGKVHLADQPGEGTVRVSEAMVAIQKEVCEQRRIQISVGTQKSGLYPDLPLFEW